VSDENILLKLSFVEESGVMELSVVNNTVEGSKAYQLLYPLAVGIGIILEDDPDLLYEAGTELYDGATYIHTDTDTMH